MNVEIYTFSGIEKGIDLIWRAGDDLYTVKALLALNVCETMCSQGQSFTHPGDLRQFTSFYTSINIITKNCSWGWP